MVHSEDQVRQEPSTSRSLSDLNEMEGKQIFLCFIQLFYILTDFMLHFYIQIIRNENEMCSWSYGLLGLYLSIFSLKQKFAASVLGLNCVKHVHTRLEFAAIIGILYIGLRLFNSLI